MSGLALAGMALDGPGFAAAGCAGTGTELQPYTPLNTFGAVITRSIVLLR